MAFSLLDTARGAISSQRIEQTATALGESPESVRRGFDLAISSTLAGFVHQGSTAVGADALFSFVRGFTPHRAAPDASSLLTEGAVGVGAGGPDTEPGGGGLLSFLFGGKSHGLAEGIARLSGLRASSAASLLGMAAPLVADLLAREVSRRNLNASNFMGLLDEQRGSIARAVPPELLASFSGHEAKIPPEGARPGEAGTWEDVERALGRMRRPTSAIPTHVRPEPEHVTPQPVRWSRLIPVALGALLVGAAALWAAKQGREEQAAVGGAGAAGRVETYRCENGSPLTVERLADDRVRVEWDGQSTLLSPVPGGEGEGFANEGYGWQALGAEGVLYRGDEVLRRCQVVR